MHCLPLALLRFLVLPCLLPPTFFFVLGLRFLLRILLAASGQLELDPNAAHKEDLRGAADVEPPPPEDDEPKPAGAMGGE